MSDTPQLLPPQPRRRFLPAFVAFCASVVLMLGSLFGFASTCNYGGSRSSWPGIFMTLAAIGAGAALVTFFWLFFILLTYFFRWLQRKS